MEEKYCRMQMVLQKITQIDGSVEICKECLVAKGFSQKAGFDYQETFSLVAKHQTIMVIYILL